MRILIVFTKISKRMIAARCRSQKSTNMFVFFFFLLLINTGLAISRNKLPNLCVFFFFFSIETEFLKKAKKCEKKTNMT